MSTPLIIFGISSFAEIAVEYFRRQGIFEPVAFVLDDSFLAQRRHMGLPVVATSQLLGEFSPRETAFHVAVTYTNGNTLRSNKVQELSAMGFSPASFVSDYCYVDPTVILGNHVFVFEGNVIQPYCVIGDRVILWSGNHIGHHSSVCDDVFISSHVVISGHCLIGARSFLGVNSCVGNNVKIGEDNWILPGSILLEDSNQDQLWKPPRTQLGRTRPTQRTKN